MTGAARVAGPAAQLPGAAQLPDPAQRSDPVQRSGKAQLPGTVPGGAIPLLRLGSWRSCLDLALPAGPALPAVSLAPEILIRSDARRLRREPQLRLPDRAERVRMLAAGWEQFWSGTVDCGGLGPQSYQAFQTVLWQAAGLPAALIDRWCGLLGAQLTEILADPVTAEPVTADPADAVGPLTLSLVALPGNTFTCLESVFSAALSGAAVWIRPSTREPFSALRLVSAMLAQGWPANLLGFYPSRRGALPVLVDVTDRQIVYGGADVVATLRGRPAAVAHGPLRVCAIVPAGADPLDAAARLRDLIATDAGRFCTAVRSILCLGDPAPIAAGLGVLLDSISLTPPDPALPQAASPDRDLAARITELIETRIGGADRITRRPILSLAGPSAYLAPTLVALPARPGADLRWADPDLLSPAPELPSPTAGHSRAGPHPLFGFEPPFPFATIMAVSPAQAAGLAEQADIAHHLTPDAPGGCPR